jgi:hypothetical protein
MAGLSALLLITTVAVHHQLSWFKDYQTLITGIVGSVIALATLAVLWHQHQSALERKRLSLRAYMPDALSALSKYCRNCFEHINTKSEKDFPTIDPAHINIFKEAIEFNDTVSAKELYEIINFYQVTNARMEGFLRDGSQYTIVQRQYDLVWLNALILNLFDHARSTDIKEKVPSLEPTKDNMLSSLRSITRFKDHIHDFSKLEKKIERKFK